MLLWLRVCWGCCSGGGMAEKSAVYAVEPPENRVVMVEPEDRVMVQEGSV